MPLLWHRRRLLLLLLLLGRQRRRLVVLVRLVLGHGLRGLHMGTGWRVGHVVARWRRPMLLVWVVLSLTLAWAWTLAALRGVGLWAGLLRLLRLLRGGRRITLVLVGWLDAEVAAWRCSRTRAAAVAIRLRGSLRLLIVVLLLLLQLLLQWRRRRISLVLVRCQGANMAARRCSRPRAATTRVRLRGSLVLLVMLLPLLLGHVTRRGVLRSSLASRVAWLGRGGQPVRRRRSGRRLVSRLLGVGLLLLLRAPLLRLRRQTLRHLRLLLLLLLAPQPLLLLLLGLLGLLVHGRLLLLVKHVAAGGRRRARGPMRLAAPLLLRVWLLTLRALPLLLRVLRWLLLRLLLLAVLLSPRGISRLSTMYTVLVLLLLLLRRRRAPVCRACPFPGHEARGVGLGEAGGLPWRQRRRRRRHEEAGGVAAARRAAAGGAAAHGAAGGRGPGGEVADVAGVDALAALRVKQRGCGRG